VGYVSASHVIPETVARQETAAMDATQSEVIGVPLGVGGGEVRRP
jgi:hypothetical protein